MRLALTLLGCLAAGAAASASKPQTPFLFTAPAALGVYEGAGCDGVARLKDFAKWFGRKPDQVIDFVDWSMLEARSVWLPRCWANAGQKSVVFSIPMLPGGQGATLAQGASGKYDALFRDFAGVLKTQGYGNAVIRLGWEFNGDWYPWAASKDPASWIAYWKRIVTVMRAVPGTAFRFDWCAAGGGTTFRAEDAYPGDDFVDLIGLDVYNATWNPAVKTPAQRWDEQLNSLNGLRWHRDFAAQRNKAMTFPEWGTGTREDGHGAGDDANFIDQMSAWIDNNTVAYHNYWDYAKSDYNGKLSTGKQPKSGAAFIAKFRSKGAQP
jgi:hypothetical protein